MKKISFSAVLVTLLVLVMSCEKEDTAGNPCVSKRSVTDKTTPEEDSTLLIDLYTEIYQLSGSSSCQSSNGWRIAPIGSKPCGGPSRYIAYRAEIDVDCFLQKVNHYTVQTDKYNRKYGLISDCMIEPMPKSVICENGKPVFLY